MLAAAAAFQCVLPPWWLLFKKVVPCQAGPTFVPDWKLELFALNCVLSPHLCVSLARATHFLPAEGQMLGPGGKHPVPHSG